MILKSGFWFGVQKQQKGMLDGYLGVCCHTARVLLQVIHWCEHPQWWTTGGIQHRSCFADILYGRPLAEAIQMGERSFGHLKLLWTWWIEFHLGIWDYTVLDVVVMFPLHLSSVDHHILMTNDRGCCHLVVFVSQEVLQICSALFHHDSCQRKHIAIEYYMKSTYAVFKSSKNPARSHCSWWDQVMEPLHNDVTPKMAVLDPRRQAWSGFPRPTWRDLQYMKSGWVFL